MGNLDVRVIATDGNQVKEILYINHKDTSIVYSYRDAFGSGKNHTTYHEDGYVHMKTESPNGDVKRKPVVQGPPLSDFHGFFGAQSFGINKRPDSRFSWGDTNPNFDFSQKDAIVYIDVRNAEKHIKVHPYFLEPGMPFTDIIEHPGSEVNSSNLHYQVITKTDPWTAIAYYSIDDFQGYLQPHSKEFVVIDEDGEPLEKDTYGRQKLKEYRQE